MKKSIFIVGLLMVFTIFGCSGEEHVDVTGEEDLEQTPVEQDADVSDVGDNLQFMFETPAGVTQITAENLDSGMPNLHYDSDESETIISADEQRAWIRYKEYDDDWSEMTEMQSWDSIWEMYYEDQFQVYHSMIQNTDVDEITDNSIRIYDIDRNPSISSDLFRVN